MNYGAILDLVEAGVNGLEIKNCDKIQEIPNLPELSVLSVQGCSNLKKIHVKKVQEKITLVNLPELTEFSMDGEYGNEIVANHCPKFLLNTLRFEKITYQEGCLLAHQKYCPESDYVQIKHEGANVYYVNSTLPDGKSDFGCEFRTCDILCFENGEYVKH